MSLSSQAQPQGAVTVDPLEGFDPGRIYLITEERMRFSQALFQKLASSGRAVLCLSRMHPEMMQEKYQIDKECAFWLSERKGPRSIAPGKLSLLRDRIGEFVEGKQNAVAILDGIEYLSIHNDFRKLNIFFEELNDLVMESQAILLIPVDPRVFDRCSLARLRRFAEVVG
jgi:hypothetical protein